MTGSEEAVEKPAQPDNGNPVIAADNAKIIPTFPRL